MKISEHFDSKEFVQVEKSGGTTPCDFVKMRYIANHFLEPARAAIDGNPIWINSGKRSPAHNKKIGGAEKSEHLWNGEYAAVDIDTRDSDLNKALFLWLHQNRSESIGQLIIYYGENSEIRFIHMSIASDRHTEMDALAMFENGQIKRL